MAAPDKLSYVMAFRQKAESTYGTYSTPGSTDGVQLYYPDRNLGAPIAYDADFDGDMGPAIGSLGTVERVGPSGISARAQWPIRAKGAAAAYGASVFPNIHLFLLSSGLTGAVTTTGGSEKWDYTPTPAGTAWGSHSVAAFVSKEQHQLCGGISSWSWESQGAAPPIHTFDSRYIVNAAPADANYSDITGTTYALTSVNPPLASSVALVFGSLTANAILYSSSFKLTREIDNARVAQTASGAHLGFVPGGYVATLEIMLEKMAKTTTPFTAASAFDEYQLWLNATKLSACSIQIGTTQYNRYKVNFGARAQVIGFVPAAESPVGKTTLTIQTSVSTPVASDGLTVTFD